MAFIDLKSLEINGWVCFEVDIENEVLFIEKIAAISNFLGIPTSTRVKGKVCEKLQPIASEVAKPYSLSKQFSDGEFPLHNDTAHWIVPCRYIVLACLSAGLGNRQTWLLDTHNIELDVNKRLLLYHEPFRFVNGKNSFFGTVLSDSRKFIRFDPGCMRSITSEGAHVLDIFSRLHWESDIKKIQWVKGKVLIIDNWRILHGRGLAELPDEERTLIRVSIV